MRSTILVLGVALAAGSTQARAEWVAYNLTGTITSAQPADTNLSFAVGDHISWTLQYNTSSQMYSYSGTSNSGSLTTPLITNIVDRTTGASFYVPSTLYNPSFPYSVSGSRLSLSSSPPNGSPSFFEAGQSASFGEALNNSGVLLNVNGPLPTLNLANLQLNSLPINWSTSSFGYSDEVDLGGQLSLTASVDSISAPRYGAPEPGSLTLFLLGAAALSARGMRRRLGQVG
jgi:hypothetical protein